MGAPAQFELSTSKLLPGNAHPNRGFVEVRLTRTALRTPACAEIRDAQVSKFLYRLSHGMSRPQKAALRTRGRPRDEVARQRILKAALELMEETTFAQVTAEAIAERAGAGKATVYRWWPNKAAVVIEAFREAVTPELPFPDTASLRDDLQTQARNFASVLSSSKGRMLKSFIVAARSDPDVAAAFRSIWSVPRRKE